MVAQPVAWVQGGAAFVGLLLSIYLLGAAWFDFRLLRRLGKNGLRERITLGDVVGETCRVLLHGLVLYPTIFLILRNESYPLNFGAFFLMTSTAVVVTSSVNSYLTRRACLRSADVAQG